MYKAARDVHTNGIHNTFTSKGRGKMNHIKQFFREKGLYLFCLAMVFAATAAGILALRTVVSNVADLTRTRKEALQNDSAWTQPDTAIDKPAQDVPKPTTTPAATEKPSATPAPAASQAPKATAAPPAQTVTKAGIWDAKPLAAFSGNELVYSATLGDWRTHNGADYAAPAGCDRRQGGQGRLGERGRAVGRCGRGRGRKRRDVAVLRRRCPRREGRGQRDSRRCAGHCRQHSRGDQR